VADIKAAFEKAGKTVAFLVVRGGQTLFIPLAKK
jgi:hypothetical protein